MRRAPMHPAQRPALRAGHPAVWMFHGEGQHVRDEARQILRELLAGYLGTDPYKVPLHFAQGHAPSLHADWQGMRLSISMSYSQDVALIAICPGALIGIDLTDVAPTPDWAQVASLYLGPESVSRLAALDGVSRDLMFAAAWAELEARGKCLGLGLQEWSSDRQELLQGPSIQVSTDELDGSRSGLVYAIAVARDSTM